jgi:murein tripeptide amidase MpaA
MNDLKKLWARIRTEFATLINGLKKLSDRSEQTLKENDMLPANDQAETVSIKDPAETEPIKDIPHQAPPAEQPQSFPIWRNIMTRLPDEYDIPNPEIVHTFAPMTAEYYRHLFPHSSQHPHLLVDEQVWTKIMAALPPNYSIPDREMI